MSRFPKFAFATVAVLSIMILTQGCVSRTRYRSLEDKYNILAAKLKAAEDTLSNLGAGNPQAAALRKRIADLQAEIALLEGHLNNALAKLRQKNGEIAARDRKIAGLTDVKGRQDAELVKLKNKLDKALGEAGKARIVNGMVEVNISSDLLFNLGSADLKNPVKDTLQEVAVILQERAKVIRIDGHTDNNPVVKTKRRWIDNWGLSCARATAVLRFLKSSGVKEDVMFATGYGQFKPVADNKTKQGQRKNRRVEIFIKPKKATS